MELLKNGIVVYEQAGFPLGTDSMLLAHFASAASGGKIADLGSGWGTLGLLLCAQKENCFITGIERNAAAHEAALENIRRNSLGTRLASVLADVREIPQLFSAGSFDCVISNPPYFPAGSGKRSEKYAEARSEEFLTLPQLCANAAWLLPTGGKFFLIHRPERLCDIFCALRENALEPKRLQFVRHKKSAPLCLVLIEARRGGRPGLQYIPDFIEFTEDGLETPEYKTAYLRGETP